MRETKYYILLTHDLWLMNQVNKQLSLLAIANHIQILKNSCLHFLYCVRMCNLYEKMQYFFIK